MLVAGGKMLVLTRKKDQTLVIGDNIEITVLEIQGDQIRFGINAPKNVKIYRKEIYLEIQQENKNAAKHAFANPRSLSELINLDSSINRKKDNGADGAPHTTNDPAAAGGAPHITDGLSTADSGKENVAESIKDNGADSTQDNGADGAISPALQKESSPKQGE